MFRQSRLTALAALAACAVLGASLSAQTTFTRTPGLAILDNASISDNMTVSGLTGTTDSLTVELRINHTFDADLDIWLIPPGVTWAGPYQSGGAVPSGVVELSTDNGSNGDNFGSGASAPYTYTRIASAADPLTPGTIPITSGGAPFISGVYTPEGTAALAALYGVSPNGTWTLAIADDLGGDIGTLIEWRLIISASTPGDPEINLQQPAATNRASGSTIALGTVPAGVALSRTFTVQNLGATQSLNITSVSAAPTGAANCTATTTALSPASPIAAAGSSTFDLQVTPTAGGPFECTVTVASNDVDEASYTVIVSGNAFAKVSSLPFSTSFESTPTNLTTQTTGTFPTATAVGTTLGTVVYAAVGQLQFAGTLDGLAPATGAVQAGLDWPGGNSAAALDFHFDLSAFNAATDVLYFRFRSACRADDDGVTDNVFISLDGGATWAASIFNFVFNGVDNAYVLNSVDVSAALVAATLNYTNNVVIRVQAGDNSTFAGGDGVLIDDVSLGRDPEIDLQRPAGTSIANGASTNIGNVLTTTGGSFTFTIANQGDFDLNLTGVAPDYVVVTAGTGAPTVSVTTQPTTPVAGSGTVTFTVQVTPAAGPFDFQISIANNDATGSENPYVITVNGTGITNAPPVLALATSTDFAAGSDFDLTVAPGASLTGTNGAVLTVTDSTPDPVDVTITFVTGPQGTTAPTGITPPANVVAGAGAGFDLTWTGTADATNAPGTYEWDVELDDSVSVVNYTVRIIITNTAPAHTVVAPTAGTGVFATPYTRSIDIGSTTAVNIATINDANTGQNVSFVSQALTASPMGSSATHTFSVSPASGNPVTLVCTPSAAVLADLGDFDYTVTVQDNTSPTPVQTVIYVRITIVGTAPSITSTAPTTAAVGILYSYQLTATGNPATFTFGASPLPAWLSINGTGLISGTPTAGDIGTTPAITATAANGIAPNASQIFTITVAAAAAPLITSTAVTTATEGTLYTYTFTITGNPTPTLSLTSGTLPAWLTLVGNTLSGTPPTGSAGTVGPLTFTATNGVAPDATQSFSIVVSAPGGGGSSGGKDVKGCSNSTDGHGSPWLLAGLVVALVAALRLRRRTA